MSNLKQEMALRGARVNISTVIEREDSAGLVTIRSYAGWIYGRNLRISALQLEIVILPG